ncbi:MAG: hypothetical protein ACRC3J_05500 [Culicoidibacterales bacterium]
MIVTLIGSRVAPTEMLVLAKRLGEELFDNTVIRRSGGAIGMDRAWLSIPRETDEIYLPLEQTVTFEQEELASTLVPRYEYLNRHTQLLFARNTAQILGQNLDTPADAVYFWAPEIGGKVKGGTRVAINLAKRHGIPCFNLYDYTIECKLREQIGMENVLKTLFG